MQEAPLDSTGISDMNDPRHAARILLETKSISRDLLWLRYWAQGGTAGVQELDAYVHGALRPEPFELKLMDWALEALPGEKGN